MTETLNINITTEDGIRFIVKVNDIPFEVCHPDLEDTDMFRILLEIIVRFQKKIYGHMLGRFEKYDIDNKNKIGT